MFFHSAPVRTVRGADDEKGRFGSGSWERRSDLFKSGGSVQNQSIWAAVAEGAISAVFGAMVRAACRQGGK